MPPKGTAGFARSRVKGSNLSPFPPANINVKTSRISSHFPKKSTVIKVAVLYDGINPFSTVEFRRKFRCFIDINTTNAVAGYSTNDNLFEIATADLPAGKAEMRAFRNIISSPKDHKTV